MIVAGSRSQALAAAVADELGVALAPVEYDSFPDGELLAATPGFDAERAIIVSATTDTAAIVELLQLQDAVSEAGADSVLTVLPYMGYARQDRPIAPGETAATTPSGYPVSARAVARAVSVATDRVVLVDPHEPDHTALFDASATTVSAAPRLADPVPDGLAEPVFLAPDEGATDLAGTVRDAYGRGTVDAFEKVRLSGDAVDLRPSAVDVSDRDVVLVDDIIATGSTMATAVEFLQDDGAMGVYVACVHAVLARNALTKLYRAGVDTIVATDTVERSVSAVSAAPPIATEIRETFL